jgi:hypothetical protein
MRKLQYFISSSTRLSCQALGEALFESYCALIAQSSERFPSLTSNFTLLPPMLRARLQNNVKPRKTFIIAISLILFS